VAVPEQLASQDDLALVDSLWADWSPGYDAAEDVGHAKEALRPAGHLRAAISYYRDAPTGVPSTEDVAAARESLRRLEVPLLYLHGARDGCIGLDSVELVRPWFPPRMSMVVVGDAGHFVQLEQPEEFNRLVVEFIAAAGDPGP
jgi:pimeloyl-ACP methyl ester carboxylesterase